MKPRLPITDRAFRYRPSASTDLRKTFAAARKRMAAEAEQDKAKVMQLRKVRA